MGTEYTISAVMHKTTVISGVQDYTISPNQARVLLSGDGAINNTFTAIGRIEPQINFTTTAVKTALLGLGGADGIPIDENLDIYMHKTSSAIEQAADTHIQCRATTGLIIPQTLTIPIGGSGMPATLTYTALLLSSNGVLAPVAFTGSSTLVATLQAGAAEAYVLGSVAINDVAVDVIGDITVNFGLQAQVSAGTLYPTNVSLTKYAPSISIPTSQMDIPTGWGLGGVVQGATDSVISLDDMVNGAVRGVAPFTMSVTEGGIDFTDITGNDGTKVGTNITIIPTYDGTTSAIAFGGTLAALES